MGVVAHFPKIPPPRWIPAGVQRNPPVPASGLTVSRFPAPIIQAMSKLHTLAINAEGFAFNPLSGECFRVNPAGETVIALLRQDLADEEIARRLAEQHGIGFGQALSDVLEFRTQLGQCRLLD